jgi:hypothetical protein
MMRRRLFPVAVFFAALAFLSLTVPANHSEAEDAYYYARMAQQGTGPELFHAHHLLYLPLMRGLFCAAQHAGYSGNAFSLLTGVSVFSGALAVFLFAALLLQLDVPLRCVAGFAAALLFSYGFWRYSTTVEIYTPASALSLLTVYCAVRATDRRFFVGSVLSGGMALLVHLVTLPVVLLAVPSVFLFRRQRLPALLYTIGVCLIVLAGCGAVIGSGIHPETFVDSQVQRGTLANPFTWLSALAAWGQTVLSGNFLFSIPAVSERIVRLFPFHMLQEELFMGAQAPAWIPPAVSITFGLAAGLAAGLLAVSLRYVQKLWKHPPGLSVPVLIWLVIAAGMALCFEPANPEMWICVLPPFWLLAALVWSAVPERRLLGWLPAVLAAVLLLHNWVGGMSLVRRPEGDYCRQKAAWIIQHARPDDLILTADSHSFVTFLEFQTRSRVLDAKFAAPDSVSRQIRQTTGRVFVFSDIMDLLPPVAHRAPASVREIHATAESIRAGLHPVHSDQFGTVYQWTNPDGG